MDIITKRQKLHDYIEVAEDDKVDALYTILKEEVEESYEWWNDEELIIELDRRSDDLKSGKDPGVTLEESKQRLTALFKKNG